MRRAPEDDLEVLPVAAAPTTPPDASRGPRPPRRALAIGVALAVTAGLAATIVATIRSAPGDPAASARALVAAWYRATAITDAADRAALRVRVLVPIGDVATTFRALRDIRMEERRRLAAVRARVDDIDADADVAPARNDVRRALTLRERRARLAAEFFAANATGARNFTDIERRVAITGRDATDSVEEVRRRYDVDRTAAPTTDLPSAALTRALGPYGRVVDAPLGIRLVLVVDRHVVELDPDVGAAGRVRERQFAAERLVALGDGTVLATHPDGVRPVARAGAPVEISGPISHGTPFPSRRPDAAWITTPYVATEIRTTGEEIAGPFRVPTDRFAVAAVSTGLVVFGTEPDGTPTLAAWSPPGQDVRPLANGWFVAARGDTLAVSPCTPPSSPADCTLAVIDVRTGRTRPVPPPDDGEWRYDVGAISPDRRWLAVAAESSRAERGLLLVELDSLRSRLVRVASRADLPHSLVWDVNGRVFALQGRTGASWARPGDAELHPIRLQVAFDRPVQVDALAVVAD